MGKEIKAVIFIIGAILLLVLGYVANNFWPLSNFNIGKGEEDIYCTMEAKMCPDGSYVGRVAPNCDFSPCPNVKTGILKGKVSIGPLCPTEPCSTAAKNPYISRMIVIKKQTGELLFNASLSDTGNFETEIVAGTYILELSDCNFLGCQPKTITIEENKTAEINIDIDTGIR